MQSQQQSKIVRKRLRIFSFALLAVVALCLCGYQMSTAQRYSGNKRNTYVAPAPPPVVASPSLQEMEVIDGSKNPEQIPDHVAYGMVFRLLANRTNESEKQSVRAYINQLGLGAKKCIACGGDARDETADPEIDALLAAAETYNQQVSSFDLK
jgi:hypothetical protein